ncbi:MAG: nitroreductase family protein [Patescibacteria group bacterium]|jgi:nitroreductase
MINIKNNVFKIRKPKPRFAVIEEIKDRFSPRHFSSEMIPEEDMKSIFEAARFAPSGWNFQPWYFYWSRNGEPSFKKISSCLSKYNWYATKAAVLIIGCFIKKTKGKKSYYRHDLGASVMSLVLQAQHLGYYSRQMGEFNSRKLIKLLNIEKLHCPFVVIALGKLGDYDQIDEALLKRELDPKPRKEDFVKKI